MRRPKWSKRWWLIAALPTVVALGVAAFVFAIFFRAQHTLDRAGAAVASEGHYAVELSTLGRMENPGFEAIASPATYVSGAWFEGKLYLSGPLGLFVYGSRDGVGSALLKSYRVGLDLPAAPLGAMVVGRLRDAGQPELLIATHGEGVLVFSGGVDRSDGLGSFRQIRPVDAEGRDVTALLPLPTGELLMGTARRGLLIYRGNSGHSADDLESFHPAFNGLAITALAADATGFWAGTRNHGLRHWHAGEVDTFEAGVDGGKAGSLPDNQVDAIAVRGNRVYAGTPLGVEEFDDGRPARVLARNLYANAVFADASGLTVGTMDEGIRRVALDTGRRPSVVSEFNATAELGDANNPAVQFLPSATEESNAKGETLFAVMRDGPRRKEAGGGWARLVTDSANGARLTDSNISALAFDGEGRLWVGYFDRGVDILSTGVHGVGAVEHREDDHLFCVNRIALDPRRGTMAVATANGLVLFDGQGHPRQVMTRRDGLIADHVNDVAFSGETMVTATPAGLTFVDGAGARSLYAFQGLVNNHVYALGVRTGDARTGEMLAGTLGGVSVLAREAVERNLTTGNSGLKHNWVTAIVPDTNGTWMVGTYGAGIMRLDRDGRFTAMDGATRTMVVNPNAMLATGSHVFAGTLESGLWVWSRATGRWRQVTAGLPSKNVTALAEHDGEIYVGTENGLVRIAERLME